MKTQWWHCAIAYEIYPRSFRDANGDGIGDIQGIIEKLPYLAELGVTMLWLCPVFVSPMVDNGYDVADYRDVDPVFGKKQELFALIKQASDLGIQILLDLVINHSSDRHPWFQSAITDANSPYREYYVICEGKNDGPPNNWRSQFGGPAWTKLPSGNAYYLHIFASGQPDLNCENPRLRKEIYDIVHWWIDCGVTGFRLNAVSVIKKDSRFHSLPPDGLANISPTCLLKPGIETFFAELRDRAFAPRKAFTVAEAASVPPGRLKECSGPNGYFYTIFDFSYADIDKDGDCWHRLYSFTIAEFRDTLFQSQLALQGVGYDAPYLKNHDQPRSPDKYLRPRQRTAAGKKMLVCSGSLKQAVSFHTQSILRPICRRVAWQ